MQPKFAAVEVARRCWSGFSRKCLPGAALASAIVLGPAGGISGHQRTIRTSLQATLTVVSGSGSLSVARVAGEAATGSSKTVMVHPWCSPSCIVFFERDSGVTRSPRSPRGNAEGTPGSLLVTPETDTARLTLPAGSDRNAATLLIYF